MNNLQKPSQSSSPGSDDSGASSRISDKKASFISNKMLVDPNMILLPNGIPLCFSDQKPVYANAHLYSAYEVTDVVNDNNNPDLVNVKVNMIKEFTPWDDAIEIIQKYTQVAQNELNKKLALFILERIPVWREFQEDMIKNLGKVSSKFMRHFMGKEPFCRTKSQKLFKNYPCFTSEIRPYKGTTMILTRLVYHKKFLQMMGWTKQSIVGRLFEDGVLAQVQREKVVPNPFREKGSQSLMNDMKNLMDFVYDLKSKNTYVSQCRELQAKLRSGITVDFKAKFYILERYVDGEPGYDIVRVVTDKDCPVDIKESDIELVYPYQDIEFHKMKEKEWSEFLEKFYNYKADVPFTEPNRLCQIKFIEDESQMNEQESTELTSKLQKL